MALLEFLFSILDLSCTITTEDWINGGKLCVSRLSDTTNAHLAECGSSGYDLNLCCSGGSNN